MKICGSPFPRHVLTALLLGILLSACTREVRIFDVSVDNSGDNRRIVAHLSKDDANYIRNQEIYAGFLLLSCDDKRNRYPFSARVDGKRSPEYPEQDRSAVPFEGEVPNRIYAEFDSPCLAMEGGSYLSGSIKSNLVRLDKKP